MTGFCYPELTENKAFSNRSPSRGTKVSVSRWRNWTKLSKKKKEAFVWLFCRWRMENISIFPGFLSSVIYLGKHTSILSIQTMSSRCSWYAPGFLNSITLVTVAFMSLSSAWMNKEQPRLKKQVVFGKKWANGWIAVVEAVLICLWTVAFCHYTYPICISLNSK